MREELQIRNEIGHVMSRYYWLQRVRVLGQENWLSETRKRGEGWVGSIKTGGEGEEGGWGLTDVCSALLWHVSNISSILKRTDSTVGGKKVGRSSL